MAMLAMSAGSMIAAPCFFSTSSDCSISASTPVVEAEIFSDYADAGVAEAVGIEELRVIGEPFAVARGGGGVVGVCAGESA